MKTNVARFPRLFALLVSKSIRNKILSILSLIPLFGAAILLDSWYNFYRVNGEWGLVSHLGEEFLLKVIGGLIISVMCLGFGWLILYRNECVVWLAFVFILMGGTASALSTILGHTWVGVLFIAPNPEWHTTIVSSQLGLTKHVGAFVLAVGLLRLLPNRVLWPDQGTTS